MKAEVLEEEKGKITGTLVLNVVTEENFWRNTPCLKWPDETHSETSVGLARGKGSWDCVEVGKGGENGDICDSVNKKVKKNKDKI